VIIFIDAIAFISSAENMQGRLTRALYPIIIISREPDFSQIIFGYASDMSCNNVAYPVFYFTGVFACAFFSLFSSFKKSAIVYNVLLCALILWSTLGFFLLQRFIDAGKELLVFCMVKGI